MNPFQQIFTPPAVAPTQTAFDALQAQADTEYTVLRSAVAFSKGRASVLRVIVAGQMASVNLQPDNSQAASDLTNASAALNEERRISDVLQSFGGTVRNWLANAEQDLRLSIAVAPFPSRPADIAAYIAAIPQS